MIQIKNQIQIAAMKVDKVRKAILDEVDHISSKVSDPNRRAYSFYIYLIPFENIEDFRKDIIKGVKGE